MKAISKVYVMFWLGLLLLILTKMVFAYPVLYTAGCSAVGDYHGYMPNLPATVPECQKFRSAIEKYGGGMWKMVFYWTNDNAWEKDFKKAPGWDNYYADNVDLLLFAGHGSQNGFYFGTNNDDRILHYNDAEWGNKDLEWIIIDACEILKNNSTLSSRWANNRVFKGLHYILGYGSVTFDVDTRGRDFIKYAMHYKWSVRRAWWAATILSENGTTAAYLRAENSSSNTYNDHLWGFGYVSPDPINPIYIVRSYWGT